MDKKAKHLIVLGIMEVLIVFLVGYGKAFQYDLIVGNILSWSGIALTSLLLFLFAWWMKDYTGKTFKEHLKEFRNTSVKRNAI